jgi:hypothetical protein
MFPKNQRGRVRVIGPARENDLPIALDPAVWKGGMAYANDGRFYGSDGVAWRDFSYFNEALTLAEAPTLVTVGAGGDYPDINQALRFLARFVPPGFGFQRVNNRTELRLLSGFVVASPVAVANTDLSWVDITSVDAEVSVSTDYFDPLEYPAAAAFNVAFLFVYNSPGPRIATVFTLDYVWPGSDTTIGPDAIVPIGLEISPGSFGQITNGGFKNFAIGMRATGGVAKIENSVFAPARSRGVQVLDAGKLYGRNIRSAKLLVERSSEASFVDSASFPADIGARPSNLRADAATDSNSDVQTNATGIVHMDAAVLGGATSKNRLRANGAVFQVGQPFISSGHIQPDSFTVATVPSAAAFPAHLIHVSNGDSGAPCLAVSNGTSWLRIPLGAAVST